MLDSRMVQGVGWGIGAWEGRNFSHGGIVVVVVVLVQQAAVEGFV